MKKYIGLLFVFRICLEKKANKNYVNGLFFDPQALYLYLPTYANFSEAKKPIESIRIYHYS